MILLPYFVNDIVLSMYADGSFWNHENRIFGEVRSLE